jgi:hypothetical protein
LLRSDGVATLRRELEFKGVAWLEISPAAEKVVLSLPGGRTVGADAFENCAAVFSLGEMENQDQPK